MDKRLLYCMLFFLGMHTSYAQKGDNQVRILAEVGFPMHDEFRMGGGAYVKFLYGVGRSGQVSLTTGASKFRASATLIGRNGERTHIRTVPVLLGYKINIKNIYIEPAIGYGELGGRDNIGGDWARHSIGASYLSLGAGYELEPWTLGIRYQVARGTRSVLGRTWDRNGFEFVGLQVAYTLWHK